MAEKCKDLPEECWELIFKRIPQDTDFESLSLVCKEFLYLTNRLRVNLSVIDPTILIHGKILPLIERFPHLKSLYFSNFHGNLNVMLLDLANSCSLPLEEIDISNANCIPIKGLNVLGLKFKCLRVLKCCRIGVLRDNDLVAIANSMPCLEELDVSYPRTDLDISCARRNLSASMMTVTDGGIEVLATRLKNLRKVNVSGNHFITNKSLVCLSINCAVLEEVVVKDCTLITSNGVLALFRNCVNLRSISVKGIEMRISVVEDWVCHGRGLCSLELWNSVVSDEFLCLLAKARVPLKRLSLSGSVHFSFEALLLLLSCFASLQYLAICDCFDFLKDEYIRGLSPYLHSLLGIKLNGCSNLTISTFYTLVKSCPLLEDIELDCLDLGKEGTTNHTIVDSVKHANIRSLSLASNRYLTDDCLMKLALSCPNLEMLDMSYCPSLTEKGIAEVLDRCREIKLLRIVGISQITTIGKGSELPKLEVLQAAHTAIDDEGLTTIGRRCPRLLKLNLAGCVGVTNRGVEEVLTRCNMLREINLKNCEIDDGILGWMVFSQPSLVKIVPPSYSSITENLRKLYLHHGCQVCES